MDGCAGMVRVNDIGCRGKVGYLSGCDSVGFVGLVIGWMSELMIEFGGDSVV